MSLALTTKWVGAENIELSMPHFYPPWILMTLATLSKQLQHSGLNSLLPGIDVEQLSIRLVTLFMALPMMRPVYEFVSQSAEQQDKTQRKFRNTSITKANLAIIALLFFVRVGALEQLLILAALLLLRSLPSPSSQLDKDILSSRLLLATFGFTLALSGSGTWTWAIGIGALLYFVLFCRRKSWLQPRLIWPSICALLTFSSLYLFSGSYQSLMHNLTLRWLSEIDVRHSDWGWSGSSYLWKAIALTLSLFSARRLLMFCRGQRATSAAEAMILSCVFSSGIILALKQRNPLFEDIYLQGCLYFFCSPHFSKMKPLDLQSPGWLNSAALKKASPYFFFFVVLALSCLALLGIVVFLSPSTSMLPELQAWISAVEEAILDQRKFIIFSAILWALIALVLKRTGEPTLERRSSILAVSALFVLSTGCEIRASCLWDQLHKVLSAASTAQALVYLPPLESFITIAAPEHKKNIVTVERSVTHPSPYGASVVLLLPSHVSDLCQATGWKIEKKHGIFTLCRMNQDSLWKLLPLN